MKRFKKTNAGMTMPIWNRNMKLIVPTVCTIAVAFVSSCAVGPDFKRPAPPAVMQFTATPLPAAIPPPDNRPAEKQRFVAGDDIPAQWWSLFHSPALDSLIARALKSNPDLQSARAALRAAKENIYVQEAAYFPTVGGSLAASRNLNSTVLSPTLFNYTPYFDLYSAQLSADWIVDIWGGNRRAVEALKADAEAQHFQVEAALLSLTAALAASAIQEASLRAQISATEDIIQDETKASGVFQRQLSLGQVSGADVAAQETALAQARQSLPPLQKQLAQERNLITVLAGRFPSEQVPEAFNLRDLALPHELPLSVPARLVDQRPDVRAAEAGLHSAEAEVGVAIANELPNISLSATDGAVATRLAGFFGPGNAYWSAGAGLSQTIFDGGALLHKTRAARALYDRASAQYRSTVLTAFQNVADTLEAIRADATTLDAATAAADAANRNLKSQNLRLKLGDANVLAVLNAEQAYEQASISLVQARASRLADSVALFEALGGGWWNAPSINLQNTAADALR
ncbi:MAG TPA: efflux transporter outer membrane subunit [Rhizomicrobium sp.]|jgi:NodT family efflux transporter outer membrane factor (OMF) lipoprotein|nr:efflux transporter outer membrane subunit [Rhizomicrobium sp.]